MSSCVPSHMGTVEARWDLRLVPRPSSWNALSLPPVGDYSWALPGDNFRGNRCTQSILPMGTLRSSSEYCISSRLLLKGLCPAMVSRRPCPGAACGPGVCCSVASLKDTHATLRRETLNKLQEEKIRSPHFPRTQGLPHFGNVLILNLSPP